MAIVDLFARPLERLGEAAMPPAEITLELLQKHGYASNH
jgi:hypothetical protein